MHPIAPTEYVVPRHAPDVAASLLEVVTDLADAIAEENALLSAGYPAGQSEVSERKIDLSDTYADLWDEVAADADRLLAGDPATVRALMDSVVRLRALAAENAARLEAAMEASRQRVQAVLDALDGDSRASGAGYRSDGGVPLAARLSCLGTDYHA
mgnify:CR=1 FL=1